ncbi:MAG: response regulator transcription factor [Crocinitomicaceae bacterium]|nr:response regulator transcription factor [Crocinitomicaceae bacterium]
MTRKIKAIIVDDEERARDVISTLLQKHCPEIQILDQCKNVKEAVESIKKWSPDVVFLDIEMPEHAGYELVDFFEKIEFEIIFVTAYDQYAIKAFELSAIDYLLKPIEIKRLKEAIERVQNKIGRHQMEVNYKNLVESFKKDSIDRIIIPHKGEQMILPLEQILAIEAKESYSVIHCDNSKNYMVSRNLKHFESLLNDNSFFRCHKSWLINTSKVSSYSKKNLEITLCNEMNCKLSKYKKAEFENNYLVK